MNGPSARSSHLSQPVVKSVLVYRNGDPFFAGRRVVIHEKKVSSFDVFLKEVTGGVQAPFGAVRNIYTPRTGHRIRKLDQIESGGNYVAGGQEAFKKLKLYTLEGKLVESGAELENGQFYVAVGRDKFKRLPYSELLFDKSAMRRPYGQKASSLPPMVGSRKSKGSGNYRQSKSTIGSSDNSSPQPLKRKGKKDSNTEKPTKVKQNVKSIHIRSMWDARGENGWENVLSHQQNPTHIWELHLTRGITWGSQPQGSRISWEGLEDATEMAKESEMDK
ncbi:Dcdc2a [Phodopus roborovskii]|uniref:Dcdc2a protein n=1 Tax=Phodopus roborovskii TaxID=109678 RepID=A0AAU9ZQ10_PHORO|nr:Dcdc2a [Phodopus roborovskii]